MKYCFRPKKGFGIPLPRWIRDDLRKEIQTLLLSADPFLNATYVRALWENHLNRRQNNRKHLWNLYTLKRVLATWNITL